MAPKRQVYRLVGGTMIHDEVRNRGRGRFRASLSYGVSEGRPRLRGRSGTPQRVLAGGVPV